MEREGGDLQTRFAHLLQPIRDLAKNWDIDVATLLEEYLAELEHVTIAFDGGGITSMNFAEAALLIQGSACVYSRKVEYLYALVYQTLDLIASKKKLAQSSSVDEEGRDTDATFTQRKDKDDQFLTLDDICEANNIAMTKKTPTVSSVKSVNSTIIPRTPMSLIPLHDSEKLTSTPLYSRTNELLGDKMDFKINSSTLHKSGALLLELMDHFMPERQIGCHSDQECHGNQLTVCLEPVLDQKEEEGVAPMEVSGIEDMGCHDDSTIVPPVDLSPDKKDENIRSRLRPRVRLKEDQKKRAGPSGWRKLDPHEPSKTENKPFRKGSTQQLPQSLQTKKSRKRKTSSCSDTSLSSPQTLSNFLFHAFYSYSSLFSKNPLKFPSTAEFEAQYWAEQKRRKYQNNRLLARVRRVNQELALEEKLEEEIEDDDTFKPLLGEIEPVEDHQNQLEGAFALLEQSEPHAMDFQGAEPMALDNSANVSVDSTHNGFPIVQSYEDLVRHYVESTLTAAVTYAQETELSRRVREWEERIKPRLLAEEQNSAFNIHDYGGLIVESLSEVQQTGNDIVSFYDMVQGKDTSEICRMFAASLQLANDHNIEISSIDESECNVDTMGLKLVSSQLPHYVFANFRAPSLKSPGPKSSVESNEESKHNRKRAQSPTEKTSKGKKRKR